MAAGRVLLLLLLVVLLGAAQAGLASASPFLSDGVFQASGAGSKGRSLLQAKKSCPMSFEFQNYTIITSQCKGPQYPADKCCGSFKQFACPFYMYLNDESNDCASTMFSYINLYGKYPPGLFSSECREDKVGLSCEGISKNDTSVASGVQRAGSSSFALVALICGVAALLFH